MSDALSFVIVLFGDLLLGLGNINWVLGYSLLQWLVAGSFMVLIWQLVIYVLSRSSSSVRKSAKSLSHQKSHTSNYVNRG